MSCGISGKNVTESIKLSHDSAAADSEGTEKSPVELSEVEDDAAAHSKSFGGPHTNILTGKHNFDRVAVP